MCYRNTNETIQSCIRRDIRNYNSKLVEETIENSKNMKVLRRKTDPSKQHMHCIRTREGQVVTERTQVLTRIEDFYGDLLFKN